MMILRGKEIGGKASKLESFISDASAIVLQEVIAVSSRDTSGIVDTLRR